MLILLLTLEQTKDPAITKSFIGYNEQLGESDIVNPLLGIPN